MSASKPSPIDAGAAALAEAGGAAGGAPAPAPRAGASLRRWVSGLVVAVILLAAAVAGCAVALGAQAGGSDSAAGTSSLAYAIVIDAGSSGSRVSIYTVQEVNGAAQDLLSTSGEKTEPGLSSYGADAAAAAASLRPLLDAAVAAVPPAERGATPVVVGA
jgi:Golgi nucleoside diphosphatase